MAAENDTGTDRFELDGVEYEVPDFQDLTLEDWEIVYDEAKVVLTDFAPLEDKDAEASRIERLKNPRVEKAFLMIGYLRTHPDQDVDTARILTGRAKLIPLLKAMSADADDAADPTSATEQEKSSAKSSADSKESSSPPSPKSSEKQVGDLATTGTSG